MMAEDMIDTLGHRVVRTAASLADAHAACDECEFDAAFLDVNLNGENSKTIAERLKARGCPLAFTTGYGVGGIDPAHADMPVLTKPYAVSELEAMLTLFADQGAGSSSSTSSVDSKRG